jgi:hypothetical protein
MLTTETLAQLESVRSRFVSARNRFHGATEEARSKLFFALRSRRDDEVRATLESGPGRPLDWLAGEAVEYLHSCDWALLDVYALAVALGVDGSVVEELLGPALVYQSLRMVDDVVDGHRSYKGAYETLYGYLRRHYDESQARAFGLLAATAVGLRGAALLSAGAGTAEHARRTLVGMALELQPCREPEDYLRMVDHKMVSYSRLIYGPVLESAALPSEGRAGEFFDGSFVLGQVLNDLADIEEDTARQQPNFWLANGEAAAGAMLGRFEELVALAADLPAVLDGYAQSRLADLAQYALDVDERLKATGA